MKINKTYKYILRLNSRKHWTPECKSRNSELILPLPGLLNWIFESLEGMNESVGKDQRNN